MTTFTDKQQTAHRKVLIEQCRQKAWTAACNAAHFSTQFDRLMGEYEKLTGEDVDHEAQIKALELAIDYHTKENRDKRKVLQERRNVIAKQKQFVKQNADEAYHVMQQLYANVESNLELAKHAEKWKWKEVQANSKEDQKTL